MRYHRTLNIAKKNIVPTENAPSFEFMRRSWISSLQINAIFDFAIDVKPKFPIHATMSPSENYAIVVIVILASKYEWEQTRVASHASIDNVLD